MVGIEGCTCISTLIQIKDVRLKEFPIILAYCTLVHVTVWSGSMNFSFWKKLKLEDVPQLSEGIACIQLDEVVAEQHDP